MKTPLAAIGLRGFPGVQGGVERHCAEILPHLDIPCRVYRRKPFMKSKSPAPRNITFVDLPSTRIKGFEAAWHTVLCVAHLLFHPVRIVNIHNIGPALLSPLLKLRGMRVVLTYHSTNYHHQKWGKFAKMILKVGEKIGFRFSDRIIFVNESMIGEIKNKEVLANSVVIPNPISKSIPTVSTEFCDRIGVRPKKYILAVGRLTPEKGFETLIRAAASIPREYKIVIAGGADNDSSYFSYLKSLDKDNRVIFTGYADRITLTELYSHARLFVLPSLFEGMSLALLEAMSFNLPVCASDIVANRLPELEKKAIFFKPNDEIDLQTAIHTALSSERITDYNLSRYAPENVTHSTSEIYRELLNN